MATKQSSILQALQIIGPEEILKLAQILSRTMSVKRVVGDDFDLWDDAPQGSPKLNKKPEGKVLPFPKSSPLSATEAPRPAVEETHGELPDEDSELPHFLGAEAALLHREISREADEAIQKLQAKQGYRKTAELLIVKTKTQGGKEKLSFVSTRGVLVDKKQA